MTPICCNLTEFAALTGSSRPTVGKWLNDGMPAERSGKQGSKVTINPPEAIQWLLERERMRQRPQAGSLQAERLRLVSEQADSAALDNAKRRGELIDYDVAEHLITWLAALVVSRLEGVAGRLANDLVNEPNPAVIRVKLLSEHRAIRAAIANGCGELAAQCEQAAARCV